MPPFLIDQRICSAVFTRSWSRVLFWGPRNNVILRLLLGKRSGSSPDGMYAACSVLLLHDGGQPDTPSRARAQYVATPAATVVSWLGFFSLERYGEQRKEKKKKKKNRITSRCGEGSKPASKFPFPEIVAGT